MDIIGNLITAADPAGLVIYASVMAFILGTLAFARLRDERMITARKASRRRNRRD